LHPSLVWQNEFEANGEAAATLIGVWSVGNLHAGSSRSLHIDVELGRVHRDIVVLDASVVDSTPKLDASASIAVN
jgi:hypothetical protein